MEDRDKLLKKIEDTWIGTFKIRVNVASFQRGEIVNKLEVNECKLEE